jgi:transcriptional regulator with XRE-family HTH domain
LPYHVRDYEGITNVMQGGGLITFVKSTDEDTPRTVGGRVKQVREQRKLSQAALAKAAGVSQGAIGNFERDIRKKPRDLLAVARALDVNPAWLETGKGQRDAGGDSVRKGEVFEAVTADEMTFLRHYRQLLGSDRQHLLKDVQKLAKERQAQRQEMLEEAGVTGIMARAAHATRVRRATTTADPADPRLRQEALFPDDRTPKA